MTAAQAVAQSWPASAAAVPAARRFVREHLRALGVPDLVDDAELVLTELVTNVVLHVGGTVRVAAHVDDEGVLLEVTDSSPVPPMVRVFSETSGTGRGLRLIHSLCAEHGVVPGDDGKTVWVRLRADASGRGEDELAAAFADTDWLAGLDVGRVAASAPAGRSRRGA